MTNEVERKAYGGTDGQADGVAAEVPLHPIALALRATFDAENHATLGRDVTGLMLDLSRVPFEPHEFEPVLPPLRPLEPAPALAPSWLERARLAMRRMRRLRRAES